MTNAIINFPVSNTTELNIGEITGCKFGNDMGNERSHYGFIEVIGKQARSCGTVYLIETNEGVGIATQNPEIGHLHCTNFMPFTLRDRDLSIRDYGFYEAMKAV